MNHGYFVLDFAHSTNGRVKRIQFTYKSLAYLFCTLAGLAILAFGLFSSYVHMSWKVSHYNQLRTDFEGLRARYQELQRISRQHTEQMASLETLASEVTIAYGIHRAPAARPGLGPGDRLTGDARESIEEYNFLKAASFGGIYHRYGYLGHTRAEPSLWPVDGVLRSSFGERLDPFSGEGAFHTGIDVAAPVGTPVVATADGVITNAGWSGSYGKLVVVDHGGDLETYYAHLSQYLVVPGQEVHRGEVIALSGGTGRATGPHIHYEVRVAGTPVNPYRYLGRSRTAAAQKSTASDLGL
ncbi:MAG: M23 family metallopeptidase [Acidobacteriaceae bacterium]|nr:M23 family metallopeptidase [Acidobacteriaceae bacterium]